MIAASATPMGRATTPPPGAQSRWPRAVAQLHLALRSPAARSGRSGRWMGCFRPAPVPAPWSPPVTVAVNEGRGERPETTEVDMEPARGGGEDLWSVQADAEVALGGEYPEHLVVMVNGLVGSADDWKFAAEQFVRRMPDKVIIHRSQCNSATQTFDGVDLMGERLANEVLSVVEQRRGVKKISIVAHSLGGLVARYAIGRLYECSDITNCSVGNNREQVECLEGLIAGLKPMNFITFASPHLGSSGNKQLPFLCGLPFLERRASETAHLIVGRTGKHLFLTDNDDGRRPLLLQMVQDHDDIKFRSGLRSFKRRVAYANANFDHMVGWRTSSIRRQHELPKHRLLVRDEKYPHIVHVDRGIMDSNETEVSANLYGPEAFLGSRVA
ncbi:putative lipase ROG1 isoform X2 [Hordeum vulgare subsp. vulgare]|uniref:putative lipase ROG1 isoform X2 n=1 Tax=Hordeum vulgare subsp. vulgare TaxID=112509 RepID=UPI001D1A4047|nr:putative lipase ROG1 isoform X2 [Hordeum vulgare subsp. vulgare]